MIDPDKFRQGLPSFFDPFRPLIEKTDSLRSDVVISFSLLARGLRPEGTDVPILFQLSQNSVDRSYINGSFVKSKLFELFDQIISIGRTF